MAGYIGTNYLYANHDATIRYDFKLPIKGEFDIRLAYQPHANRGDKVRVEVEIGDRSLTKLVNMRQTAPLPNGFISLGRFQAEKGESGSVTLTTAGAGGHVHADAVQVIAVK